MTKRIFVVLALAMVVGCAQLQPITGSGRFLQQSIRDQVFLQIDTASPEACRREGNAGERHPLITINCATVSQSEILPYIFNITNQVTGEKMIVRARTPKACEIFRKEFDKLNTQQIYEADECN